VAGSKSRTGSRMQAFEVVGQEIMYCHVPVLGSKTGRTIGSGIILEIIVANLFLGGV